MALGIVQKRIKKSDYRVLAKRAMRKYKFVVPADDGTLIEISSEDIPPRRVCVNTLALIPKEGNRAQRRAKKSKKKGETT